MIIWNYAPTLAVGYWFTILLLLNVQELEALKGNFEPLYQYVMLDLTFYALEHLACAICYCSKGPTIFKGCFVFSILLVVA